jgi:hypothetical protein
MSVIGNFGPDNTSLKTVNDYKETHSEKAAQNKFSFVDFCPRPYTANERWTLKEN